MAVHLNLAFIAVRHRPAISGLEEMGLKICQPAGSELAERQSRQETSEVWRAADDIIRSRRLLHRQHIPRSVGG